MHMSKNNWREYPCVHFLKVPLKQVTANRAEKYIKFMYKA